MFKRGVYERRREALRQHIGSGIIVLPGNVESPVNYPSNCYRFRQDSNFLYFFGLSVPGAAGVIDADSGKDLLFIKEKSLDDIIWSGPSPSADEYAAVSGTSACRNISELGGVISEAMAKGRKVEILPPYREETISSLAHWLGVTTEGVERFVSEKLIRAVVALREIKEPEEIAEIDLACDIAYEMHTAAMAACRPGTGEREIAGLIEGIALSLGAGGSFIPIVTQNGETLHNHSHSGTLASGRLLLIDAGAETVMNYCSDITRTLPVGGKFSPKQRDIYEIVLSASDRAFSLIREGVTYTSVHTEAQKVLAEGLKNVGIVRGNVEDIVEEGVCSLFMPHGLGHQMGLDVHDMEGLGEKYVGYDQETRRSLRSSLASLRMGRKLAAGHVVTVEPGIYFIPALMEKWQKEGTAKDFIDHSRLASFVGFGGIRIEDNALVTTSGCRLLGTKRVPVSANEIEEITGRGR